MALNPEDPRHVITAESFGVTPELLGAPLAGPWRRLWAMALDGILVAIMASTGAVVLGGLAAVTLFKASRSKPESTGFVRAGVRGFLRLAAAVIAFVVVANVAGGCFGDGDDDDDEGDGDGDRAAEVMEALEDAGVLGAPAADTGQVVERLAELEGGGVALDLGLRDVAALAPLAVPTTTEDSAAAAAAAAELAAWHAGKDYDAAQSRAVVTAFLEMTAERPVARRALVRAFPDEAAAGATAADEGVPEPALPPDDTPLSDNAAAARIADLEDANRSLREERDELTEDVAELRREVDGLEGQLAAAEGASFISGIKRFIDEDLGIGFGWGALYFTAFLALWNGRTPGKRALGIRVIRLDGRPISWWIAFERFGGYAASAAVGLLGFAQLLWDRNRQGLHDKAVETVVVRDIPRTRWKEYTGGVSPFEAVRSGPRAPGAPPVSG